MRQVVEYQPVRARKYQRQLERPRLYRGTFSDMCHFIARKHGMPVQDVRLVVISIFRFILAEVFNGVRLNIPGFGTFVKSPDPRWPSRISIRREKGAIRWEEWDDPEDAGPE